MPTTETWGDWEAEPTSGGADDGDGAPDTRMRNRSGLNRRAVLTGLAALGVGTATFRRALAAQAAPSGRVTPEMIKQAEWIAGITFTDDERARSRDRSTRASGRIEELRKVDVGYDVPPALTFFPAPPRPAAEVRRNRATPIDTPHARAARLGRGARVPAGRPSSRSWSGARRSARPS